MERAKQNDQIKNDAVKGGRNSESDSVFTGEDFVATAENIAIQNGAAEVFHCQICGIYKA